MSKQETEICQVPCCGAPATFHAFPSNAVHPDEGGMQTCDEHLAEGMSCISGQPMPEHWRVFVLHPKPEGAMWRSGDFVRLDGTLCVVVDMFGGERARAVRLLDAQGKLHHWTWAERSDGTWPTTLVSAKPGKHKGKLLAALDKFTRRRR